MSPEGSEILRAMGVGGAQDDGSFLTSCGPVIAIIAGDDCVAVVARRRPGSLRAGGASGPITSRDHLVGLRRARAQAGSDRQAAEGGSAGDHRRERARAELLSQPGPGAADAPGAE